ncbi:MAG: hypothetical protein VXZ95_00660 [Candidatus Thermoplasmatota archaeon]|nr:hypothetical protein [Candidatus Thermoplasmatota archaeon]
MTTPQVMLEELFRAKLDDLRSIAAAYDVQRSGGVDLLRARLIRELVLDEWDLSEDGIAQLKNNEMGDILGAFGIKKTGSIRARRQRLYLHLNHDAKALTVDSLNERTKEDLHALAKALELPVSGTKQTLQARIAGVLEMQRGAWGPIKRSLRRDGGRSLTIPVPDTAAAEPRRVREPTVVDAPEGMDEAVEAFTEAHPEGWTAEEEAEMREALQASGVDVTRGDVAAELDAALRSRAPSSDEGLDLVMDEALPSAPSYDPGELPLDAMADLEDLERREAEVEAACRHFLSIGKVSDSADVDAFLDALTREGFDTGRPHVREAIRHRLMGVDMRRRAEEEAQRGRPTTWRAREALRVFESLRPRLIEAVEDATAEGDTPEARSTYLRAAKSLGVDVAEPAVSGRVHALYDLHVDLMAERASMDPVAARRQRALRVLFHGSVHMDLADRRTLERLERGLPGFEDLISAVLDDADGRIEPTHEALILTYLERRGLEVNTPDLRPRVMACAGVLAAELGLISPSEIPRLAPGIVLSDDRIEEIVDELKQLAASFRSAPVGKAPSAPSEAPVERDGRHRRVDGARSMVDRADDVLARLLEER